MNLLGFNRDVTQNFNQHGKRAEDYSGPFNSEIKIDGTAKVTKVIKKFKNHEDSINYQDFGANNSKWKDGEFYNCISITGKHVRMKNDEVGGNCCHLEGIVDNQKVEYRIHHMGEVLVSVGDIINVDKIIGYQGNTGLVASSKSRSDPSYGTHVHFEVYVNGQVVDPRNYATGNIEINVVKQDNSIDSTKNQIEILVDSIRIRETSNTTSSILGFAKINEIYTVLNIVEDPIYKWYNIKTSTNIIGWIASDRRYNWIKEKNVIVNEEEDIDEDKPNVDIDNNYTLLFKCSKKGTYYLKLFENEELYIKKAN